MVYVIQYIIINKLFDIAHTLKERHKIGTEKYEGTYNCTVHVTRLVLRVQKSDTQNCLEDNL
jgi:hypothetical protein